MDSLDGRRLLVMRAHWEQAPLVQRATELGATVLAVDELDDAAGFEYAGETRVVDDLLAFNECLSVAREGNIDGIATDECDFSLRSAAYIGERLGLPNVDLDTAFRTTDKGRLRDRLGDTVPQPAYRVCESLADVRKFFENEGHPGVVKPVDSRGAFGVTHVTDLTALRTAYLDAMANSRGGRVITESFVEGTPLTVEGYVLDGDHRTLAIGSKDAELGNLTPDREIVYPAQLPDETLAAVRRVNETAADVLDVAYGATHAEYIVTPNGKPYLIEFHNRGGGIHISNRVVPRSTGFDVSTQLVHDAVSVPSGQEDGEYEMTGVVLISQLRFDPGVVTDLRGLKTAREHDDVLVVRPYFDYGDELTDFETPTHSHGLVITAGDSLADARARRDQVEGVLTPVYR